MRQEMRNAQRSAALMLLAWVVGAVSVWAQPPAGYYSTIDATNATTLRLTLHEVIDDHTRFPYTASTTDTWDIINLADEDPGSINNIVDIYKNASYSKIPGGVGAYNREHSWPKSYGFPDNGPDNYPYTDTHHLFASDVSYNAARENKPFRVCNAACTEHPTEVGDGRGGGTGVYPGNSNWTSGSFAQGIWETWNGRKGDVARAIFYMDVRYEGGSHGVTGIAEPDLIVTDSEALIASGNTGSNESVAYMGMLSVLLQWHAQDPPDSREMWRDEVVFSFQGNRNPFIDHPEWVACLFSDLCAGSGDTTPPAAPTSLVAVAGSGGVDLLWSASPENDLAGYHVLRGITAGGPYVRLTASLLTSASFTDSSVANGTTYFYVVRAVDTSANESGNSNEVSATPTGGGGGGPGELLLSEILYDVSGGDSGFEWVELYNGGGATVDLAGFCLGNGGTHYTTSTVQLAGFVAAGETFVVGGPTSSGANANPVFDQTFDFNPDFQNAGSTGDGVALFAVPCSQVSGATVPIDAVVYGPNNNNSLIDETGSANSPEVGDASAGSSLERVDMAGTWQIRSTPTPNTTSLNPPTGGPTVVVLTSLAGDDGWVRESSELSGSGGSFNSTSTSASALRAGDNRSDRQFKGVVSFDTSSIPNGATILSAKLRLRRGTVVGTNPFNTHGTCWVDVHSGGLGGSTTLAAGDFQAPASVAKTTSLSNAAANGDWSEGSLDAMGLTAVNKIGTTQLRFYFDRDDNDDRGNDYIGFYSANNSAASKHPQLVVTYQQ